MRILADENIPRSIVAWLRSQGHDVLYASETRAQTPDADLLTEARLREFLEKRPGSSWINAGIYLVRHRLLERFPQTLPLSWELDVFPTLIRADIRIQVHRAQGAFLDIGLPESLAQGEAFIRGHSAEFV